ncbi:MAG: hypothetical protein WC044_07760 [Crocinitomicaceae bacterium]
MKNTKQGLMFLFVALTGIAFSQKITILEGDLSFLKGEKILNVEYDYSNFGVGKFKTEKEYVDKKVAEYNAKEAGKGDKWKDSWEGDRAGRFEPQFELLFNKTIEKQGIYLGNEKKAKYKMIVHTTFVEPGFNIYVTKKYAAVDLLIDIVAVDNPSKILCQIVSKGNPGRTYGYDDFDTGLRISEAYELAGKKLGAFIFKALGK